MKIFDGIDEKNLDAMLNCLQAVKKTYFKGENIFDVGDKITSVVYVKSGSVQLIKDDYEGNRLIVSTIGPGEIFAEAFVCSGIEKSRVCAKTLEDTQVLFLNFKRIISVCPSACSFHKNLIENLIKIIALKNVELQGRLELLSKKTLRERILYFLYKEKAKNESAVFEIPFSREQMAEYIGADRSALSRELSKMQEKKIISYHKNSFRIN